ncbi:conserved hypothetical protein [Planktothrix rubescens CCAP 1459/22]|uniref:Uncharacterized protein n=1 Tax=Planktothrix rubescens CCAP 1459/22 TaxID=329571 RepID=A0A6J7ZSI6_PLARU|nr:conserved hypothetical protein [Planktothrix rubescens NIVA-CYA 18]CAD5966629.1 hypothetical protein PCC7821_03507 [Planktothrix rubescens NIVA-CYA 18]
MEQEKKDIVGQRTKVIIVLELLRTIIQSIQPFLVPTCFVLAWGLFILITWSIVAALRDTVKQAKQMHQIPCADCIFFTGDYHLKCPVQPTIALSEAAINCPDYRSCHPNSSL